jgi:cytochrome b6-f complex iron-sulfur subunit
MSSEKMTRRQFVRVSGVAVGAAAVGPRLLAGCGAGENYPKVPMTDGALVLDLEEYPELRQVGEGILFQVPNNVENIVVVNTEGGYRAVGAECPHKGCSVRWQKDERLLVCPCHKSSYTAEGKCTRGPGWTAPQSCEEFGRDLRPYDVQEEGGKLLVTMASGTS